MKFFYLLLGLLSLAAEVKASSIETNDSIAFYWGPRWHQPYYSCCKPPYPYYYYYRPYWYYYSY